jgi:hypothetical protein
VNALRKVLRLPFINSTNGSLMGYFLGGGGGPGGGKQLSCGTESEAVSCLWQGLPLLQRLGMCVCVCVLIMVMHIQRLGMCVRACVRACMCVWTEGGGQTAVTEHAVLPPILRKYVECTQDGCT